MDAFQRYDMEQLVTLLADDALMTMPPFAFWVRGAQDVCRWMQEPGPRQCAKSVLVPAGSAPKAIIVPHAGYDFSGPIAASAYARYVKATKKKQKPQQRVA